MSTKRLKICERGHKFYKSSDCPSCPICASEDKPVRGFLSRLGRPARGALAYAGISALEALSRYSQQEISAIHGVGPKSRPVLRQALHEAGPSFAVPG